MKVNAAVILAVAQVASAHYFFENAIVGGAVQSSFKYIRKFTRATYYNPIKFSSNPAADIRDGSYADGPDIRCNQGAATYGSSTDVLTINAGSEVRARLNGAGNFQHPGPSMVYMSKAPSSVKNYDGSGDWFKIHQEGVCNNGGNFQDSAWCSHGKNFVAATIPKDTPNGEYLIRFEHIGVHRSHVNQPEHYVSCMQVKVQNGGSGNPGPLVKFPGAYKATDPYATMSVYNGIKPFTFPGPSVWSGGGSGSNPTNPTNPNPSCSPLYGQCGGSGWTGATCCSSGSCKASNEWYSQCV